MRDGKKIIMQKICHPNWSQLFLLETGALRTRVRAELKMNRNIATSISGIRYSTQISRCFTLLFLINYHHYWIQFCHKRAYSGSCINFYVCIFIYLCFRFISAFCFTLTQTNKTVCTEGGRGGGVIIAADMELIAHIVMGGRENVTHLNNWILICNSAETIPLHEDNAVAGAVLSTGWFNIVGFWLTVLAMICDHVVIWLVLVRNMSECLISYLKGWNDLRQIYRIMGKRARNVDNRVVKLNRKKTRTSNII